MREVNHLQNKEEFLPCILLRLSQIFFFPLGEFQYHHSSNIGKSPCLYEIDIFQKMPHGALHKFFNAPAPITFTIVN
ncbi:hypothetical protein Mpal_1174 [Methanosphaerula palustris E1-9c]|uniref:Uncharacterized protein n=1 Tax=Methanosphaerula palustris (strain ATCC BAA-1556 / DSM 19958 / E1-9c) TaxID=521011 RepID=B8GHB1_METPE|nr:hypothetical protein Mpal_1174 [Methanosphaerula palustris E1-9c]